MQELCHELMIEKSRGSVLQQKEDGKDDLIEIALALEEVALNDEYFKTRKLFPNVDFYSGIVLQEIGFPRATFTVMFALARSIGWICHWREMMSEKLIKIGRP